MMALKLKAYRCSDCDDEFVVVMLNQEQLTSNDPYCPSCGSDEYVSSIDCINLSLSEHQSEYEIHKSLNPIPGMPPSQKTEYAMPPVYYEALKLVDKKWHKTFLDFAETGEAPKEFLDYIDRDAQAEKAVEMIFIHQSAAMQKFSQSLSKK
jgi:DNA-directed RNA polymerase subunit RPC12/RpoP